MEYTALWVLRAYSHDLPADIPDEKVRREEHIAMVPEAYSKTATSGRSTRSSFSKKGYISNRTLRPKGVERSFEPARR